MFLVAAGLTIASCISTSSSYVVLRPACRSHFLVWSHIEGLVYVTLIVTENALDWILAYIRTAALQG